MEDETGTASEAGGQLMLFGSPSPESAMCGCATLIYSRIHLHAGDRDFPSR